MPSQNQRKTDIDEDEVTGADEPIPAASDEEVLDDTARLAREGRRELENDPRERKPESD